MNNDTYIIMDAIIQNSIFKVNIETFEHVSVGGEVNMKLAAT